MIMKKTKLRIWRVVPTNQIGVQAPYFFVETTNLTREKAEIQARIDASKRTGLSRYESWNLTIEKFHCRKDGFGRYFKYHQ